MPIESDLALHYNGRSIGEWHRGEMSSRELLVLLSGLPERSRFKGAMRGLPHDVPYQWCYEEFLQARLVKELVAQRLGSSCDYDKDFYELLDPVERKRVDASRQTKDAQRRAAHTGYRSVLAAQMKARYG
ncbi:hypothetical protein E2F47_22265 [Mycobacterium eburneum]|nr:hypothetical protein [Mycobacterium eburneum]TDH48893.1 hypothetical protein E2F47_22265 [Mycobacterium eburneum]